MPSIGLSDASIPTQPAPRIARSTGGHFRIWNGMDFGQSVENRVGRLVLEGEIVQGLVESNFSNALHLCTNNE